MGFKEILIIYKGETNGRNQRNVKDHYQYGSKQQKKDLGISEGHPRIIKTPIEELELRADRVKHIINGGGDGHKPDKTRYKSMNKMLSTIKDPHLITEDEYGEKRYFKLFSDGKKIKRQFVVLFDKNNIPTVYTTMPVNHDDAYFMRELNKGKIRYKKGQTGVKNNSAVNNIITDVNNKFNPNVKGHEVNNNKDIVEQFIDIVIDAWTEVIMEDRK